MQSHISVTHNIICIYEAPDTYTNLAVALEGFAKQLDVDKADQPRLYYPVGRAGHKWWRCIMWYVVNVSPVEQNT